MENNMEINLTFKDDKIIVKCEVNFNCKIKALNFIINKNLNILNISNATNELQWQVLREYTPTFRAESKEIKLEDKELFDQVIITYEGTINGWCNFIQENAKALNYYAVWYPQDLSEEIIHTNVMLTHLEKYQVLKADFDEQTKRWLYKDNDFDCNIIAFEKGNFYEASFNELTIYYLDQEEEKAVNYIKYYYEDVMNYYNELFLKSKTLNQLYIVSLSLKIDERGGYFRNELIVFTNFLDSNESEEERDLYFGWLIAHELAHNWCTGADVDSWEDWLNETTAEWSALLYALTRNNSNLFDYILKPKQEEYLNLPQIKTEDLSRPMGVHTKGTLLFYSLYEKYGVETIEKLVQIFVTLNVKTTDAYLVEIENVLSPEIALFIEKNLVLKEFEL